MKNKKTAIEWLEDNLNFEPHDEEEFISNNKIWEQAKEMEKEQIINAVEWNYKSNMGEVYYKARYEK